MKLSQKIAISYAIRARQLREQEKFLRENNLYEDFKQSKYKSMTWYINNLKSKGAFYVHDKI